MINWVRLVIALAAPFVAAAIGSYFTFSQIPTWYITLNKPPFTPPNFIFGPVWTILYLLMGISLYLVWQTKNGKEKRRGIKLFLAQLILNALWSLVFFGVHALLPAFGVIIILWLLILLTIRSFLEINKVAAYLLYPYLVWVSFATALNLGIVILNP